MFCRWFVWCLALVVLGYGSVTACTEQSSEKGQLTVKSELVAAEYGFTVLEDVAPSQFAVRDIELVPFLNDGEIYVNGKEMRERAVKLKANLGLVDAKRILDHQAEIPVEVRSKYFVFPGTLLRDSDGDLHVAFLYWVGDCWHLSFNWLGGDFDGYNRLVRCKSSAL